MPKIQPPTQRRTTAEPTMSVLSRRRPLPTRKLPSATDQAKCELFTNTLCLHAEDYPAWVDFYTPFPDFSFYGDSRYKLLDKRLESRRSPPWPLCWPQKKNCLSSGLVLIALQACDQTPLTKWGFGASHIFSSLWRALRHAGFFTIFSFTAVSDI